MFRPAQTALDRYCEKFGDAPPLSLGKYVANTGQGDKLDAMLMERVEANDPVSNWEAFAKPLLLPSKGTYAEDGSVITD